MMGYAWISPERPRGSDGREVRIRYVFEALSDELMALPWDWRHEWPFRPGEVVTETEFFQRAQAAFRYTDSYAATPHLYRTPAPRSKPRNLLTRVLDRLRRR